MPIVIRPYQPTDLLAIKELTVQIGKDFGHIKLQHGGVGSDESSDIDRCWEDIEGA